MRGGKYLILLAEHPAHWVGTAFTRQGSQVRTLWCPPKIPRFFKRLQHQVQAIDHQKVVKSKLNYFSYIFRGGTRSGSHHKTVCKPTLLQHVVVGTRV
jgi:hypothetical protein